MSGEVGKQGGLAVASWSAEQDQFIEWRTCSLKRAGDSIIQCIYQKWAMQDSRKKDGAAGFIYIGCLIHEYLSCFLIGRRIYYVSVLPDLSFISTTSEHRYGRQDQKRQRITSF